MVIFLAIVSITRFVNFDFITGDFFCAFNEKEKNKKKETDNTAYVFGILNCFII
jgi:hypothetical protein